MTPDRLAINARVFVRVLMALAAALVLAITLRPALADIASVSAFPLEIPVPVAEARAQPALGYTIIAPAPGEQPLTPALLANYVERQQALRAFNGFTFGEEGVLNEEVLLGYIARGSLGGGNGALEAIASFAAPPARATPALNADSLARYVEKGYMPTHKRLNVADKERHCLAKAIYHEARGEPREGQLAVANVIVNRANSSRYPSTLCGVIYQNADRGRYRCQFTFACDGRPDTATERGAWARSQALAAQVYAKYAQGRSVGAVPGSTLFYHTTAVSPSWSRTFNRVAQIGAHIFYSPN